jgi:Fe-S cluster biogenesis protein NfuA
MKKKNLTCDICGKTFKNTTGAKLHFQRMHTEPFPFDMVEVSKNDIAAARTEKDWLDYIDNALVNSGIVPCATAEKPNGMDRLEAIEHLIKLVKEGQKPAPPENTTAIPWSRRIVLEFEGACKGAAMMEETTKGEGDGATIQWNSTIEKTLSDKRNKLVRIIEVLSRRAAFADEYERELMS